MQVTLVPSWWKNPLRLKSPHLLWPESANCGKSGVKRPWCDNAVSKNSDCSYVFWFTVTSTVMVTCSLNTMFWVPVPSNIFLSGIQPMIELYIHNIFNDLKYYLYRCDLLYTWTCQAIRQSPGTFGRWSATSRSFRAPEKPLAAGAPGRGIVV